MSPLPKHPKQEGARRDGCIPRLYPIFLAALVMSSVLMLVIFRTKIYVLDSVQLLKVLGTFEEILT